MLDIGRDEMPFALFAQPLGDGFDRPVVGFGAPRGQIDLLGLGIDHVGDLGASLLDCIPAGLPHRVDAIGVAEILDEVGEHGIKDLLADPGGRRIVQAYRFFYHFQISVIPM